MKDTAISMEPGTRFRAERWGTMMLIVVQLMFMALMTTGVADALESFNFVVMSDSQCNPKEGVTNSCTETGDPGYNVEKLGWVLDKAKNHDPDFVVFVGDLVSGELVTTNTKVSAQLNGWKTFMSDNGFGKDQIPIMPAWGNHDRTPKRDDGKDSAKIWSAWENTFDPEKDFKNESGSASCHYPDQNTYGYFGNTVYYCDYENARFFVLNDDVVCSDPTQTDCPNLKWNGKDSFTPLDVDENQVYGNQLNWVKNNLFDSTRRPFKPINFLVHHKPAYSNCATNDLENEGMDKAAKRRNAYIEAIAPYATMIFSGHDHVYARRKINSEIYKEIGGAANDKIQREFLEVTAGSSGGPLRTDRIAGAENCTRNLEAFDNTAGSYHYILINVDNSGEIPVVTGKAYRVYKEGNTTKEEQIDAFSYPPETTVAQAGDRWGYWKGKTSSPPDDSHGSDWTSTEYIYTNNPGDNDYKWSKGLGAFGYKYQSGGYVAPPFPCGTELRDMRRQYLSVYLRRAFAVPNPDSIKQATLAVDIDDGFVAYLNGEEIARFNLDKNPPPFKSVIDDPRAHSDLKLPPRQFPLDLDSPGNAEFSTGKNSLSIQGHNQDLKSSDFYLMPSLRVLRAPFLLACDESTCSSPKPLQGASLAKGEKVYLCVKPEEGIEAITYYLKQGAASVNMADRDLKDVVISAGNGSQELLPLEIDTGTMSAGDHSILALVEFQDVSKLPEKLTAQFRIYQEGSPPPQGFVAYNDLAWKSGQPEVNITKITSPRGGSNLPSEGNLIDFQTGADTGVTLTVTGGTYTRSLHGDLGREIPPNTDAYAIFNGKVSGKGQISYHVANKPVVENLVLTFTGLDPSKKYEVAYYGDRNDYGWNRASLVTISSAAAFQNVSSAGTDDKGAPLFSKADDPSTRLPADNGQGYVARFTQIDPGGDDDFKLEISWDGNVGSENKGKYSNCLMLKELQQGIARKN